jgi:hypothetical protein
LEAYVTHLAKSNIHIFQEAEGSFWRMHGRGVMMRKPTFHLVPPDADEVNHILWKGRAAVASYLRSVDEQHLANAYLYLCTDQTYTLDKLSPVMRRNVRRGLKELEISPLTLEQLLSHGLTAFCDNRRRNGLSDGTPDVFRRRFTGFAKVPEQVFFGAWKGDQLAAFVTAIEVEDWAELGCFSMDAFLHCRPNDTLIYYTLHQYLVERRFRLVSYGLSSIQTDSNSAGLHNFKLKVGFQALPVHRAFVLHPLLRPFVNRFTFWGVNTLLRCRPGNPRLKKASGMLALLLGNTQSWSTLSS